MTAVLVVVWVGSAHGQSLAEVAAKEKERRAKTGGAAKSYTDSDLRDAASKREREGAPSPGSGAASPAPAGGEGAPSPRPAQSPSPSPEARDEQAEKKVRGAELKVRLDATNAELKDAEEKLRTAQEYWHMVEDHPWAMAASEESARANLAAARERVERLRSERDAIEDTARRERIPPGYLR
jgi:hypothetical protein